MLRYDVPVCECDVCHHRWLAEGETPKRCPSRKCRATNWNMTLVDQAVEMARKRGATAVQINDQVFPVSSRPAHSETCRCFICRPPK